MRKSLMLAAAFLAAMMGAAQARMLRAGDILPNDSDQGKAILWYAQRVKELSGGALDIKVFPNGELGNGRMDVMLESVSTGTQDFLIDTTDYLKAWDPRFGIMNTPYVFRDRDHFRKFLASPIYADMIKSIEQHDVVVLAKGHYSWIRASDRGLLTRKPVMTPADLQGMKLRMFQAEVPVKAWAAFGANIQVIPWPDVYTALATGAVDGLTGPLSASYLVKHTEVAKYFTNVREYYQVVTGLVSRRTWDSLTPDQQNILNQAFIEAGDQYLKFSAEERDSYEMKAINQDGVTEIIPPIGPWIEKMKPVLADFEKSGILPKGLVGQIQAIQ